MAEVSTDRHVHDDTSGDSDNQVMLEHGVPAEIIGAVVDFFARRGTIFAAATDFDSTVPFPHAGNEQRPPPVDSGHRDSSVVPLPRSAVWTIPNPESTCRSPLGRATSPS